MGQVHFTAVSKLTAIHTPDEDPLYVGSSSDLKVWPDAVADQYLDGAKEPTIHGCIAWVHTTCCGMSGMMQYMVAKGWETRESFLQKMIADFNGWADMAGEVEFKTPPDGGLLG